MALGLHLLIDGMTATPPTVDIVRHLIFAVVEQLAFHIVSGPSFYKLDDHEEAFAIIAESHVAVQWWESGLVLIDLFSCKPFDIESTTRFLVETLGLEYYEFQTLERMGVG